MGACKARIKQGLCFYNSCEICEIKNQICGGYQVQNYIFYWEIVLDGKKNYIILVEKKIRNLKNWKWKLIKLGLGMYA